jgi:hypothetical protein
MPVSLGGVVQVQLYTLKSARPPWGDYGSVLWHGLADKAREGKTLYLKRTGPFVPPITFPWPTIVVIESLRRALDKETLSGYDWQSVVKKRIVALDWTQWDLSADDPAKYPAGGEPENYILGRKHDPQAASAMAELWNLYVPSTPGLQREGGAVDLSYYSGQDICRGHELGHVYISDRFRLWLEGHVSKWISCQAALKIA